MWKKDSPKLTSSTLQSTSSRVEDALRVVPKSSIYLEMRQIYLDLIYAINITNAHKGIKEKAAFFEKKQKEATANVIPIINKSSLFKQMSTTTYDEITGLRSVNNFIEKITDEIKDKNGLKIIILLNS